jgi:hypothetical protein
MAAQSVFRVSPVFSRSQCADGLKDGPRVSERAQDVSESDLASCWLLGSGGVFARIQTLDWNTSASAILVASRDKFFTAKTIS